MAEYDLSDLAESAGIDAAADAVDSGGSGSGDDSGGVDESTAEFLTETLKTLEKRGLIEPLIWGPEGAQQLKEQQQSTEAPAADQEAAGGGMSEIQLNAETVATVGNGIMSKMGDDVTLDELLAEAESGVEAIKQQLGPNTTVQDVVEIAENNPALINQQLEQLKEEL